MSQLSIILAFCCLVNNYGFHINKLYSLDVETKQYYKHKL